MGFESWFGGSAEKGRFDSKFSAQDFPQLDVFKYADDVNYRRQVDTSVVAWNTQIVEFLKVWQRVAHFRDSLLRLNDELQSHIGYVSDECGHVGVSQTGEMVGAWVPTEHFPTKEAWNEIATKVAGLARQVQSFEEPAFVYADEVQLEGGICPAKRMTLVVSPDAAPVVVSAAQERTRLVLFENKLDNYQRSIGEAVATIKLLQQKLEAYKDTLERLGPHLRQILRLYPDKKVQESVTVYLEGRTHGAQGAHKYLLQNFKEIIGLLDAFIKEQVASRR